MSSPGSTPPSTLPPTSPSTPTLTVNGRAIPATGIVDVASALAAAGVVVPDGRLLSIVTHRILNAHRTRGHVDVDGRLAQPTTPVGAGDAVTVSAGRDVIEPTVTKQVPVTLGPAATALYLRVTAGVGTAVVGAVSGERQSVDVTRAPAVGQLRQPGRVALTIDDGPSASYSAQVLGLIAQQSIPVVFCLIGEHARTFPQLVRSELAAGAQLCDHTQTHPLNLPQLSTARIAAEVKDGAASITAADGGVAPLFFRAPGGNWSAQVDADARAQHLIPLHWTVDPRDWSRPGTQTIITRVLQQLRPDGIILIHDGGGDRSQTVAALRVLLPELHAAGWTFSAPSWVR